MVAVNAHYDGRAFVPEIPISVEIDQKAIITLLGPQLLGSLSSNTPQKEHLLSLAGCISHEDYLEMEKALEDTEKVYSNDQHFSEISQIELVS